jgi:hypothetical protein
MSGKPLRTIGDKFPEIHDQKVTIIRIEGADVRFDTSASGKLALLSENPSGAVYVAVWTGKGYSDAFGVTEDVRQVWTEVLNQK